MQNLKLRTRGAERPIVYAPVFDGQIRDEVEAASRRFLLEDRQNLEIASQEIYNVHHKSLGQIREKSPISIMNIPRLLRKSLVKSL